MAEIEVGNADWEGGSWNGKYYFTDKIANNLVPQYERMLAPLRDQPVHLLEIGVAAGGSCVLWADFFRHPDTRVLGLDLRLPPIVHPADWTKVTLEICDQNDSARLASLAKQFGPFDVIIDDGCHRYTESKACFQTLFEPHLKIGGFYIVEDWAISFLRGLQDEYGGPNGETMMDFVTEILRGGPEAGILDAQIVLEQYMRSIAFFRKGPPLATS